MGSGEVKGDKEGQQLYSRGGERESQEKQVI